MLARFKKSFLLFLCLLLCTCQSVSSSTTFLDTEGKTVSFQSLKGKWIFINYWAAWCSHCRAEIPILNQFAKTHANQVIVLGVNYDHLPLSALKSTLVQLGIEYPVLREDPASALGIEDISVIPITYRIDPKGQLQKPLIGPQSIAMLEKALKE